MKKKQKSFTFVIVPNKGGKIRRVVIPRFFLLAGVIGLIIGIFALFYLVTEYKIMKGKVANLENLETLNQMQQEKIISLAGKVSEFKETLENLKKMESRLRTLAGVGGNTEPEALGRGGPGSYTSFEDPLTKRVKQDSLSVIKKIESNVDFLEKSARDEEKKLTRVEGILEEKKELFTCTPNIFPVQGWISSDYGNRINPFTGKRETHEAIDIVTPWGTAVKAAARGKVTYAGWRDHYGLTIKIKNDYHYSTVYGHLSRVMVKKGEWVEKGQVIGRVGSSGRSTGPHLHFEVWHEGKTVNPLKLMVEPLGAS